MKITELSRGKINPQRVNVFVDGKYAFSLDDVEIVVRGIKVGTEITQKEIENLLFESSYGKAKQKALDILSRKNISEKCLCDELMSKGFDEVVTKEVARELKELGYIDDLSYALLFLEMCREKLWGIRKIRYEIKNKGIDQNTLEDALCQSEICGAKEIAEAIKQKYDPLDTTDIKTKQKIFRYFSGRGFEFSDIEKAISLANED
jgi:regulatory protein